jgi:hypothetical protein
VVLDHSAFHFTLEDGIPSLNTTASVSIARLDVKDLANQWLLLFSVSNLHHLMAAVLDPLLSWHERLRIPVSL